MLRWRLLLGTLIIAALVALCWLDHLAATPGIVLFPVAIAAVLLASGEILVLERAAGLQPPGWVVYAGNTLLVVAGWVPAVWWQRYSGAAADGSVLGAEALSLGRQGALLALAAGVILAFVGEMRRYEQPGGVTKNLAGAMLALVYVGVLLVFVAHLRLAFGIGALASLVIVVKMCDTGAYTVGRLFGRHKMAPVLSPGKTWEGAAGGLLFACLGAWATFQWLVPALEPEGAAPAAWWGWIVFGLLVGGAGMLGDLAESLLKRDAGRKDSSDWLPGFGGVLDILDSILLACPVAYGCWALGLVGG